MSQPAQADGWTRLAAEYAGGPVTIEHTAVNGGLTTAVLHTRDRRLFCKTGPSANPAALQLLHIEAIATRIHQQAAAPFHGIYRGHGWTALLFDHVDGEHARFHPQTEGLALAARIAELVKTPTNSQHASALPTITDRIDGAPDWKTVLRDHPHLAQGAARDFLINGQHERMRRLTGDHVAHTDIHPFNVIVNAERLTVIDWGAAALARPWFDQAMIGLQLIGAGAKAEDVIASICEGAHGHPCDPSDLRAFAIELARYWIGREMYRPAANDLRHLISTAGRVARCLGGPYIELGVNR